MTRLGENLNLVVYVGTRRLAGLVAEASGGSVRVIQFAQIENPEGFQRGEAAEIDKAQDSVSELLKRLELGEEAFDLPTYVLLSGPHLKMARFSSSLYFTGYPRVVTTHEVRKVIDQTRAIAPLPLNDWILQVVPESFWVNDLVGVRDPLGLEAQRLAVTVQLYTTSYPSFRNLSRIFENLEFDLQGFYPKTLTLPEGVLNAAEREGAVLVIDFADDATHLVLTREGKIIHTKSLHLGSRLLTSRVAETWNLGMRDAERLKEQFGSLEENPAFGDELVPLVERNGEKHHQIKRADFHQAFSRFGEELFGKIEQEIADLLGHEKAPYASLVLTGGGVRLEGLLEFLSRRFSAPVRMGTPRHVEGSTELLANPAWSGLVGLVRWLHEQGRFQSWVPASKENVLERGLFQFKEWIAAYF